MSEIFVNIQESERQLRPIWDDLRRKVERASRELPDGVIGPLVNDEFGDVFGTIVMLTGEGYNYRQLKEKADQVRNELLKIKDVAKVEIHGTQDERIFVEYNNARLAELGISAVHLRNILQSRNILLPGGDINTGFERIVLEPSGNFESVEDLSRTIINLPGGSELVYLEDIARVYRDYIDPPTRRVRANGDEALALGISLREGGNLIHLGTEVRTTVHGLQERYPIGLEFDFVAFQPDIVTKKVDDCQQPVAGGGHRNGCYAVESRGADRSRRFHPYSDDHRSEPVDHGSVRDRPRSDVPDGADHRPGAPGGNAICSCPNRSWCASLAALRRWTRRWSRHGSSGFLCSPLRLPPQRPSCRSTWRNRLWGVHSSALSGGEHRPAELMGAFADDDPDVVRHLHEGQTDESGGEFRLPALPPLSRTVVDRVAASTAQRCGRRRRLLPCDAGVRIYSADLLSGQGSSDPDGRIRAAHRGAHRRTEAFARRVDQFLEEELTAGEGRPEGVVNWGTFVGQGPPKFALPFNPRHASPEYTMMLVNTTSYEVVAELIAKLERFCLENFPDVKPDIRSLVNGPPVMDPIEVRISGEEIDEVFAIVDRVKTQLAAIPGTKNISDNWGAWTKKLVVSIDQPRARRAGLTSQDVAVSLQTVLSGFETTQYREKDEVIPVALRSVEADRHDLGKLESLNIFSQLTGRSVPLKQVAHIEVVWEPAKVLRRDRLKTVTVSAAVEPGVPAMEIFEPLGDSLRMEQWPPGYRWEFGGEWEASVEGNESIGVKVPIAGLIIVMLLVGQFNSIRRPLIILLTIPLGLIGVVIGLLVAKSYFGFVTFLGVIALAGIIINNAIVLLDRIKLEREQNGLEPARAVIEACLGRLRPILLTTCTTMGGMLPLWYGGGPMFEPMAVAIIFGLFFATALTLGLVPVLYSLFFGVRFKEFTY